MPDDAVVLTEPMPAEAPQPSAMGASQRRVIEETETAIECPRRHSMYHADDGCDLCGGTGISGWKVTSRCVQVGLPYEQQASEAYILTLHQHIRKAAATVDQAATLLLKAGKLAEANGMKQAAQAILEPVGE